MSSNVMQLFGPASAICNVAVMTDPTAPHRSQPSAATSTTGAHAEASRPALFRRPGYLVRRLLREHRRQRLGARLERVTLREHLAFWRARRWTR